MIEAAYAYEESLQLAVEEGALWKKGATSSREYSIRKRQAAKAKALWTAVTKDLESQAALLTQDLSGKNGLLGGNSTKSKQAELKLEIAKLESELRSLTETQSWADDFKKQSLESLKNNLNKATRRKPTLRPRNPNERLIQMSNG